MSEPGQDYGALRGFRVLELAEPWGQYCGKLLADLGADVVKIEPLDGDRARALGPFKDDKPHPEQSLFFAYYNTNKRSLALDIERPEGREVLLRLAATADVLVETLGPRRTRELGLSYDALHGVNPRLVMTSLSGLGAEGPHQQFHTTSLVIFAMSGLMKTVGSAEGPPVAAPGQTGFDLGAAEAAIGTLAALMARRHSGLGQHVEVAARETLSAQLNPRPPDQVLTGRPGRMTPQLAPSGTYQCRDGAVELTVVLPTQWQGVKELLARPEELERPEWDERPYRQAHYEHLAEIVSAALRDRTQAEVVEHAQRLRVPCGPVNTVADFTSDRQVAARGFFVDAEHPFLGRHQLPGPPYRMSEGGWSLRRPSPSIGEHTWEILTQELGYSAQEVTSLEAARVIRLERTRSAVSRPRRETALAFPTESAVSTTGKLPLEGIRVVAFSTAFAGPTASRYLADFGAEVIKVESRRRADNTRFSSSAGFGGRFVEPSGIYTSPGFGHFNRNKRGIAVDLSQEKGRELLRRLIRITDVVMENFSVRVMKNWGFDYEALRAIRPDIIVLDMQGMGQTGPLREYVTYGSTLHSYSGLTSMWGYSTSSFVDYIAAEHAAVAIMAGLLHREQTARGMHIDLAQFETAAALLGTAYLDYQVNGRVADAHGNSSPNGAPSGCYPSQGEDAWCVIDVTGEEEWRRLCEALGRPSLAAEARFSSFEARRNASGELDALIQDWTRTRPAHAVEQLLQQAGIPAAAVRSHQDLSSDPHLRARGFHVPIDHPVLGTWEFPGPTIRLSDVTDRSCRPAPLLGQDNEYVFGELLGLSAGELSKLTEDGVLT